MELDKTKTQGHILPDTSTDSKVETEEGTGKSSPHRGVAPPPDAPPCGEGPMGAPDATLSPINSSLRENPRYPSHFPRKVLSPLLSSTLTREGSETLLGTLPKRGVITGGLYIAVPASEVMRE